MTDPVAAWNFDEASGPVIDYYGTRNFNLTGNTERSGGKLVQTLGAEIFNSGISMTGLNTPQRTWGADVTIQSGFTGWVGEFNRISGNTGVWGLLFLSGSLRFRAKNASDAVFEVSIPTASGTQRSIFATHDGATLKVYLNGVLHGSTPMASAVSTSDRLYHFDNAGSGATLDNFRLYDVALSQPEIAALVGVPVAAPSVAPTGRLKYESAPGVWTPVPLKTETGSPLVVKTETAPATWEALP